MKPSLNFFIGPRRKDAKEESIKTLCLYVFSGDARRYNQKLWIGLRKRGGVSS